MNISFAVGFSRYHLWIFFFRKHRELSLLRSRRTLAIIMYALYFKSMHELRRLKPTTIEIFMRIYFLKVLCISNYTLLFSALCPVRWNVANYHNSA